MLINDVWSPRDLEKELWYKIVQVSSTETEPREIVKKIISDELVLKFIPPTLKYNDIASLYWDDCQLTGIIFNSLINEINLDIKKALLQHSFLNFCFSSEKYGGFVAYYLADYELNHALKFPLITKPSLKKIEKSNLKQFQKEMLIDKLKNNQSKRDIKRYSYNANQLELIKLYKIILSEYHIMGTYKHQIKMKFFQHNRFYNNALKLHSYSRFKKLLEEGNTYKALHPILYRAKPFFYLELLKNVVNKIARINSGEETCFNEFEKNTLAKIYKKRKSNLSFELVKNRRVKPLSITEKNEIEIPFLYPSWNEFLTEVMEIALAEFVDYLFYRKAGYANTVHKICVTCGDPFQVEYKVRNQKVYCSETCKSNAHSRRRRGL